MSEIDSALAQTLATGWRGAGWDEGALNTLAVLRDVAAASELPELAREAADLLRRCKVQAVFESRA